MTFPFEIREPEVRSTGPGELLVVVVVWPKSLRKEFLPEFSSLPIQNYQR